MKQQTLATTADQSASFDRYRKPTRRDESLATMNAIVPWTALCEPIQLDYPKTIDGTGASVNEQCASKGAHSGACPEFCVRGIA
jgi:hypothetical protein